MEYGASNNSNNGKFSMADDEIEYREAIRNQITREVRKITDLEKQKAVQTLMEEQSKAMHQIIEEYTNAIRYVAQKEKEEIWRKAKAFKKSFV